MAAGAEEVLVTHIRPQRGWITLDLAELWRERSLLYYLTWRDIQVKYRQTLLGFGWAVLVPFTNMIVFGTVFGKVARLPCDGLDPYLFYLAGLVPWQYFSNALNRVSNSMVSYSHMLQKIYLPRLFIPMGPSLACLVDFLLAFVILLLFMAHAGILPAATALLIPLIMTIAVATTLGAGLILSSLYVKYRDVRFVIPFVVQLWMYCSVLLPFSQIPKSWGAWRYLFALNPMAGVIESCRWCLMHPYMFQDAARTVPVPAPWPLLAIGLPVTIGLLAFGLYYFKRMERMFADIV